MKDLQDFQGEQGTQGVQVETIMVRYQYKPYAFPLDIYASKVECEYISDNKKGYARACPIRLSPNFMFVRDSDFGNPHIPHSWVVL